MTIESFFKNGDDLQIQEYLKNIDTDGFCQMIDEYPTFIKERIPKPHVRFIFSKTAS